MSFSTTSYLLSRPTTTSAMSLGSEPLRGYRWAAFSRLRPESCTLGYFRWIGAFSPGNLRPAAFSVEFKNALADREKVNNTLVLFDITIGADDKIVGEDVTKFEDQLKQANVQHTYTVVPGGTHSMFVWRPALANFLQEIFKK